MEDTECIVAKAIRDGGVDAVLDHANGWMLSKDVADIYATAEPAAAFHARVAFCLDIHNEVPYTCLCIPATLPNEIVWPCKFASMSVTIVDLVKLPFQSMAVTAEVDAAGCPRYAL